MAGPNIEQFLTNPEYRIVGVTRPTTKEQKAALNMERLVPGIYAMKPDELVRRRRVRALAPLLHDVTVKRPSVASAVFTALQDFNIP